MITGVPAVGNLIERIHELAAALPREVCIMEICGTHTMAIYRQGIRSLLPRNVRLISGPGCPVCVTPTAVIDRMLLLANHPERIIATFGDMIRVPGTQGSLQQARGEGADVRTVYSPMDAVKLAAENPARQVVLLGIGFETTAPAIAAAVVEADRLHLDNFIVAAACKLVPPALDALLQSPRARIDALLCPGHVSIIIGANAYEDVVRNYGVPCVIAGFEGDDILGAIVRMLEQIADGKACVENMYAQWVKPEGNVQARELMQRVLERCDAEWRGLGRIAQSGLRLRECFRRYDAFERFAVPEVESREPRACRCGEVLQGAADPADCTLYGKTCTPESPVGPCMVSSEGACAAAFKYGE